MIDVLQLLHLFLEITCFSAATSNYCSSADGIGNAAKKLPPPSPCCARTNFTLVSPLSPGLFFAMAAVLPPAPLVGTLPPSPTTENLERLKSVLAGSGNRTRISVSDGRTFFGHFMCVDRDRNVVLGGTEELRGGR